MPKISEVPVLIVGGGAVGCVLSMELARRGVEYRCIERMPGPARETRAIAMHARTVEMFDLVDKEISKRILDRDLWCKGYVMHFLRDGERTEVRPGLDYTTVDSRYNCIFAHSQSETETFVREYTRTHFGKTIEYNTAFQDLTLEDDGVTARITHADRGDEEEQIRCRYLVAADGINSRVRRGLGMSVKGQDYKGSFFQNLDIFLNGFPDWKDYFHYCVGTDHFLMVAPLPGGHFRLLLSDRGEAADPNLTPQQAFMRLLDLHFDGVTMGDVVWHSKWETWVRLADTFRQGDVFLAGDAAHVHSTTGGQGMNCCMQDAFNLGWKLALVLKGYAKPELLETYETERRPVAEQVIWAASSLHDIFMKHGRDIASRTQTMFDPEYKKKVVNTCSGVAYTYKEYVRNPAELTEISGPSIGDRAPDIDFEGGGTLFDKLRHAYFTLLVMPRGGAVSPVIEGIQRRFPNVLAVEIMPKSEALSKRYGPFDGRLIVVRPDGYIGFKCRAEESHLLQEALDRVLTESGT